jgi:anti-sigma-K factor RskA
VEKQEIISSGLLEMYVTGAASPEEAAQVEKWREQYPEIKEELLNVEKAMESYAFANAITPGRSLKNEILNSINAAPIQNQSRPAAKVVSISPAWRSIAAAAVILLICSAVMNVVHYNKYKSASEKYNESERTIALQAEKLNDMDHDMGVVQNKYSQPVSLSGQAVAPDAAAKIFWMKNTGETYIDPSNLPDAPDGMQYQLWAIVDEKPVDGGMIPLKNKAGEKYHILKMKSFGKVQAFAVTLETMGGNPEPKGKMYVMGKI